jgi:hypothetical protein
LRDVEGDGLPIVFTLWLDEPRRIVGDNGASVERRGGVDVAVLPRVSRGDSGLLARAACDVPLAG